MPTRIAAALLLFACLRAAGQSPVFGVLEEFDRIAAQPLWPGFEPRQIPVALYDGSSTYLYRHPAPPKEFQPLEGHPGIYVFAGRHPSMLANTSTSIGGVTTATLTVSPAGRDQAALLVHECFHVFQRQRHPSWAPNEAALFTYPVEDVEGLALSRLEMEALRRALAGDPACWAGRALTIRRERFARLPADTVAYERGTELDEGLAQYVEGLAAGRKELRFRDFGPTEVRQRGYLSGEALARLLDRAAPGWKLKVERSLDELLPALGGANCDFTEEERQAARRQAQSDMDSLRQRRAELRRSFETQPGWRVVVQAADGKPLLLKSFDPLNVERLSEREILHTRMLQLGNDAGSLEILNHGSMTTAAGAHPLFDGVRKWTVTGLEVPPEVKRTGSSISITTPAVKLLFTGAEIDSEPQAIVIRLR
jgi:hypothetical protein